MNDPRAYWIWLQSGLGYGAAVDGVLSAFSSPEEMFSLGFDEWRLSGVLSPIQLRRLRNYSLESAAPMIRQCDKNGWGIITPDMTEYPQLLLSTRDYPLVLYVRGDLSFVNERLPIAVVGSRSASQHSLKVAEQISADITRSGAAVVSGCALGVDSAAHSGALRGGGSTVAVLGCGINVPYLMQNEALRQSIARRGAVISEYTPDCTVTKSSFPLRNRIISGMCVGTVIIQANDKSGSLITASRAAEQGRDIFAVPGDVASLDFTGVNKLIRDGAKPVFSAYDILSEYEGRYTGIDLSAVSDKAVIFDAPQTPPLTVPQTPPRTAPQAPPLTAPQTLQRTAPQAPPQTAPQAQRDVAPSTVAVRKSTERKSRAAVEAPAPKIKRPLPDNLIPQCGKIYDIFGETPLHIDDIVVLSGYQTNKVFTALTALEIYGFIKLIEGKRYELI